MLPASELPSLSLLDLKVDYVNFRGGRAPVTSKKKTSVVKAVWKNFDIEENLPSEACRRAFTFLCEHNHVYTAWLGNHRRLLEEHTNDDNQNLRYMKTAALLLNSPGIEVAARPWLYPSPAFTDTDISDRLKSINRIPENSKPSIKTSWQRKLLSRCADYAKDFPLTALMHDVTLAKQLSSAVSMADKYKISPDEAVVGMHISKAFGNEKHRNWKTCAGSIAVCQICF